jgi:hypothetical protein
MELTSGKYVVTTVRSENFLPASAFRALVAASAVWYLTKILPTPAEFLLPPIGRGMTIFTISPYFPHSSSTSSLISLSLCQRALNRSNWHPLLTFIVLLIHELLRRHHVKQLDHPTKIRIN